MTRTIEPITISLARLKWLSAAARANEPGRLAGRLAIDDVAAGGPTGDTEFEVKLMKEFKVAR